MKNEFKQFIDGLPDYFEELDIILWLKGITPTEYKDNTLTISTDNQYRRETIEESFLSDLYSYAKTIFKDIKEINVTLKEDIIHHQSKDDKKNENEYQNNGIQINKQTKYINNETITQSNIDSKQFEYSFEKSEVITEQNELLEAYRKIKQNLGFFSPLYIYGKVGVGKTHLLQCFGNDLIKEYPFLKVKYISNPEKFITEYVTVSQSVEGTKKFIQKYSDINLFLFDDIQFLVNKKETLKQFFNIFNNINENKGQIIICSDKNPQELEGFDERLKSRFSQGLIYELPPPSPVSLRKIIDFYCKKFQLELSDEVKDFISKNISGDIRQVIGALKNMLISNAKEKDIHFCQQKIQQVKSQQIKQKNLSQEVIVKKIIDAFDLTLEEIRSSKRTKKISLVRNIIMYFLNKLTDLSQQEIGFLLGKKSASAVNQGCQKIIKQQQTSLEMKEKIESLSALISSY